MDERKKVEKDLFYASRKSNLNTLKELYDHGVSMTLRNKYGDTPLLVACKTGDLKTIQWLLNHGSNLSERNNTNISPLLSSSIGGNINVVSWLLQNGCSLNELDDDGNYPLLLAIINSHFELVKWFFENGASINIKNKAMYTPFLLSVFHDDLELTQWLLEKKGIFFDINETNDIGNTGLYEAATYGSEEMVKLLLSHSSINIDKKNGEGDTPLHSACRNNHNNIVGLLLEEGCNVTIRNIEGNSPFHEAALHGNSEIIELLSFHGDSNLIKRNNQGSTVLHCAIQNGNIELITCLLEFDIPIDFHDANGDTEFTLAASLGHIESMKLLYNYHEEILESSNSFNGYNSLHTACFYNEIHIVRWLIEELQMNIEEQDDNGNTPLLIACIGSNLNIIKYLINNNANIYHKNNLGESSILLGTEKDYLIPEYLIVNGSNLSEIDYKGHTPLMKAIETKNLDLIEWMYNNGASLSTKALNGDTPLLHAVKQGSCKKIVEWLLEQNANVNESNNKKNTVLHIAVSQRCIDLLPIFLQYGAKTTVNQYNKTYLDLLSIYHLQDEYELLQRVMKKKRVF